LSPTTTTTPPAIISVVEPQPRAEEPKLNCLLEPETKLRIEAPAAAPAPFYSIYHRFKTKFLEKKGLKNHGH
jgi:hypothetical protein